MYRVTTVLIKFIASSSVVIFSAQTLAHGNAHHHTNLSLEEKRKSIDSMSVKEQFLLAKQAQKEHQFDRSLGILNLILKSYPNDANALLLHASVSNIIGHYKQAEVSCKKLFTLTDMLTAIACQASVGLMTGKTQTAYQLLDAMLQAELAGNKSKMALSEQQQWLYTLTAELAWSLGLTTKAEQYFHLAGGQQKLDNSSSTQNYVLLTYSDFLLSERRYDAVLALLEPFRERIDVRLRLLQAAQALQQKGWQQEALALQQYYDKELSDHPHHREAAMSALLVLSLKNDTATRDKALKLAQFNWQRQKERIDAKLLLEVALRTNQPEAARDVLNWVQTYSISDSVLSPLVAQIIEATKV